MGRNPTVGGKADEHSQFARDVTAYLRHVREVSGISIRTLSSLSAGTRSNSWWAEIFKGSKILTTNDIHYIAQDLLGISPWKFVDNARKLAAGEPFVEAAFSVGGSVEDGPTLEVDHEEVVRKSDVGLAALRGQNEGNVPHAD